MRSLHGSGRESWVWEMSSPALARLDSSHGSGRVFLLPQCGTWLVYIRIVPHIRVIVVDVGVEASFFRVFHVLALLSALGMF